MRVPFKAAETHLSCTHSDSILGGSTWLSLVKARRNVSDLIRSNSHWVVGRLVRGGHGRAGEAATRAGDSGTAAHGFAAKTVSSIRPFQPSQGDPKQVGFVSAV